MNYVSSSVRISARDFLTKANQSAVQALSSMKMYISPRVTDMVYAEPCADYKL